MGMFANHADVHHGGPPIYRGERCTACGNTGWVTYPVNVTVSEDDYDECPYGCEPMTDQERRDYLIPRQPVPLGTIPKDLHDAYYKSLGDVYWADLVQRLAQGPRTRGLVGWQQPIRPRISGRVTTDDPVMGLVEGLDRRVYAATIPERLVGTPVETDPLVVEYEYLGSRLRVRYAETEASFFRFAYYYEEGFTTHELL